MGIYGSMSHICKLHYDLYTVQVNMQNAAAAALKLGWWTCDDGRVLVSGLPLPNYWVWGKVYTAENVLKI